MAEQLWGAETTKAIENFQLSGQPVPPPVIHWLGRLKAAAARANAELGELDADVAERIAKAGTRSRRASTTTSSRSTSSRRAPGPRRT